MTTSQKYDHANTKTKESDGTFFENFFLYPVKK